VFDDIVNEIVYESVNRSMKNYLLLPKIFMGCSKTGREMCLIVSWWEECRWIYAVTFSRLFQE